VKFAYNDTSRPFFSFVFLVSTTNYHDIPELIHQHRSRLALQAMNVIAADPETRIPAVLRKRRRRTSGVIVIDGSDSEGHGEGDGGNESSDSETDEMERRMAELEVSAPLEISVDTFSVN
jgi:hypothetical protein